MGMGSWELSNEKACNISAAALPARKGQRETWDQRDPMAHRDPRGQMAHKVPPEPTAHRDRRGPMVHKVPPELTAHKAPMVHRDPRERMVCKAWFGWCRRARAQTVKRVDNRFCTVWIPMKAARWTR